MQPGDPRHTRDEACPICVEYAQLKTCDLARALDQEQIWDRRSSTDSKPAERAPMARFDCPGCGKMERFEKTAENARAVIGRHAGCKKGKRRGVKQRLFSGVIPKRGR